MDELEERVEYYVAKTISRQVSEVASRDEALRLLLSVGFLRSDSE
jgi:hypothetical protein